MKIRPRFPPHNRLICARHLPGLLDKRGASKRAYSSQRKDESAECYGTASRRTGRATDAGDWWKRSFSKNCGRPTPSDHMADHYILSGAHPFVKYPVTPGHEFSGVVAAVGFKVTTVQPGTRVARPNADTMWTMPLLLARRHQCLSKHARVARAAPCRRL